MIFRPVLFSLLCFLWLGVSAQNSTEDRILNPQELARKPWVYDLNEALANPDKVFKLSLENQGLKSLPAEIGSLKNLQVLNLSENKLKTLPPEIGSLTKLQSLTLYNNKVQTLPNEVRNLRSLELLYLGKNRITFMPLWMGGLGRLKRLDLSLNPVTPAEVSMVRNMLPRAQITY